VLLEGKKLLESEAKIAFDFLIGVLWNRFQPLQQPAVEAMAQLLQSYTESNFG